ncbi:MAG: DNA mismatch repair endonuclease MutL [Lachnospiraceae bacterium]|nr:DNA mismatch repair endonuclease MutL [Lachnospiraceae bacterium]
MNKIKVLDNNTIDKIAAGEVVERPASVVKELVENAIDAGADAITVEIKSGGIEYIRVTDNGSGVEPEDMATAFLRHATSKITNIDDLNSLHSMGFRGEALASIASVSHVTMISKTRDALMGHRFEIDGGVAGELTEIGAPDGTTIVATHLFYNVPVRRKFLKSAAAEGGMIGELMEHLALSRPDISFKFVSNGKNQIFTNGGGDLQDVIYRIYGREMAKETIPISYEKDGIRIDGYLGTPAINRPNRNFENYFLNNRYIKSDVVAKSLEDGYSGYTMQHKFPFCVISIEMSPDEIDVNVHPSKMDVRFHDRENVYDNLSSAVSEALHGHEMIPEADLDKDRHSIRPEITEAPEPFENKRIEESIDPSEKSESESGIKVETAEANVPLTKENRNIFSVDFSQDEAVVTDFKKSEESNGFKDLRDFTERKAVQMEILPRERVISANARKRYELIGQVFNTYWIFTYEDKLYFADQHAAHEKVNYERMLAAYKEHKVYKQQTSPPIVVSLSAEEDETLQRFRNYFDELGFEISDFGGREYAIHTVPLDLYRKNAKTLFMEILDDIRLRGIKDAPNVIERVIASMACKASVKGGDAISREQMDRVLDELLTLDNPYHCPHGRPTIFSVSRTELERKFKRIVN